MLLRRETTETCEAVQEDYKERGSSCCCRIDITLGYSIL